MAQITIGEVDWETANLPGERQENRVSDFMQLEEGDNKGRVLSNPQQFAVHWVVDETGKKRKVNCATDGCPVCQRGTDTDKPQARWLIKFFNRKEGRIQLLEISSQVFKGVKALVGDPEWGPVTEYDINIKRGSPGAQPLYTVIPGRRAPLTSEEKQALSEFSTRVVIENFIKPPTPEAISQKLGWSSNGNSVTGNVSNSFRTSGTSSKQQTGQVAGKKAPNFNFDE